MVMVDLENAIHGPVGVVVNKYDGLWYIVLTSLDFVKLAIREILGVSELIKYIGNFSCFFFFSNCYEWVSVVY